MQIGKSRKSVAARLNQQHASLWSTWLPHAESGGSSCDETYSPGFPLDVARVTLLETIFMVPADVPVGTMVHTEGKSA